MPYFTPVDDSVPEGSFSGSILILPVVSLGNVPQLAADLLLHSSLGLRKAGSLSPRDHIPVAARVDGPVGSSRRDRGRPAGISTPCEVYQTAGREVTVLQQRSPVLKSRKQTHIASLSQWIRASAFKAVVLLVSVDAATRSDEQLRAAPLFSLVPAAAAATTATATPARAAGGGPGAVLASRFPPLRRRRGQADLATGVQELSVDPKDDVPFMPAGGLARRLFTELQTLPDVDLGALVMFVAEGDNRLDAKVMAEQVAEIVQKAAEISGAVQWQEPLSWHASSYITREVAGDLFG